MNRVAIVTRNKKAARTRKRLKQWREQMRRDWLKQIGIRWDERKF